MGSSQPSACDTLFRHLREKGEISEVDIWERKMLAWQQGESGLASYLGRQLGSHWQEARDAKARLQGDYSAITRVPNCIGPECRGSGALFAAAMHGFTRADTEAAMEAWRKVAPYLTFDGEHRHAIEEDLAFYSLVRNIDNNRGWVDDILPRVGTARVLELRVRHALTSRDWTGALRWIEAMPDETRDNSRWQYWKARAHEQLGDSERAQVAYARAADGRNFFAFAASDRLNRPYSLNLERNGFDEAYRQEVASGRPCSV
ncbi:hypothetical protein Q427_33700, partial [Halomonas sp. BC04]